MLSIVVLTYGREDLLTDCLRSIDSQELPAVPIEKVIVDNGSRPPIATKPGWRIMRLEKNVGHVAGQNWCMKTAYYDWVLFVSNDVRFRHRAIRTLWKEASTTHCSQLMPEILWPDGRIQTGGLKELWPGYWRSVGVAQDKPHIIPSITYLLRYEAWKDVKGFDEAFIASWAVVKARGLKNAFANFGT